MATQNINADFPFESQFVEIFDAKMHYIESGEGDPILFLHGNPTSSYLWRNIIPYLASFGRCIAPDLIGMGKSENPDIEYTFTDHARYLEAFIEKLNLKNLTIVGHDWGGALGCYYAMRYEHNMKGLALMETILKPFKWSDFGFLQKMMFKKFRDPEKGKELLIKKNFFVEKILPMAICRKLSQQEMARYREPFLQESDRLPIYAWPNQIPIEGKPAETFEIISEFRTKLESSLLPKLLLWAKPGVIIKKKHVKQLEARMKCLETVCIGRGKHYIQEDEPHNIGIALTKWYKKVSQYSAKVVEI